MNRRRRFTVVSAAAVTLVLLTGCVEAPFDEAQLQTTEEPGVAAARLNNRQARRAAQKARQAKAPRTQTPRAQENREQAGPGGEGSKQSGRSNDSSGVSTDGTSSGDGGADGATEGGQPRQEPSTPGQPAAPFRVVSAFDDPAGDASGQAPGYADIRNLLIESNGTAARVTVSVAERIPRALADGEVQGLGIDFYRSDDRESDFQLFLDGGSDGWLAYIHRPSGVEEYPGRFAVGGRVFVLTLPWSALGGARQASVSMFIDWSQERTVLNAVGNDRAPEDGRFTVDPR